MKGFNKDRLVEDIKKIKKHPIVNTVFFRKLTIKEIPQSSVFEWNNCYFVDGAKDVEKQLKTILRVVEAKSIVDRYITDFDEDGLDKLGYVVERIWIDTLSS